MQNNDFRDELVCESKDSDSVVPADDFSAQVGKLNAWGACVGRRYALPAQQPDNGDKLPQFSVDNHLFLSGTNFRQSASLRDMAL